MSNHKKARIKDDLAVIKLGVKTFDIEHFSSVQLQTLAINRHGKRAIKSIERKRKLNR